MSPARASPTIGPMGAKPFLQTTFSLLFGSGSAKNEATFIPLSVPSTPRPDVSAPPQLTMPQNSESKNPNEDEHIQPQATLSETTPHFAAKSSISPESQLDPYLVAWVQRLQKLETETSALQSSAQAVRATVIARATNGIASHTRLVRSASTETLWADFTRLAIATLTPGDAVAEGQSHSIAHYTVKEVGDSDQTHLYTVRDGVEVEQEIVAAEEKTAKEKSRA